MVNADHTWRIFERFRLINEHLNPNFGEESLNADHTRRIIEPLDPDIDQIWRKFESQKPNVDQAWRKLSSLNIPIEFDGTELTSVWGGD